MFQIQRRRSQLGPVRRKIEKETVTFRTPVDVKYLVPLGYWSVKTLAAMELVVKADGFQITLRSRVIGGILGSEWYFLSQESTIESSGEPNGVTFPRKWIVARTTQQNKGVAIAFKPRDGGSPSWNALVATCVQSLTGPPDT